MRTNAQDDGVLAAEFIAPMLQGAEGNLAVDLPRDPAKTEGYG